MKKTFLFDLDGTLIDSFSTTHIVVNSVLTMHGAKELTKDEYKEYFHHPGKRVYMDKLPHIADHMSIVDIHRTKQVEYAKHLQPFAGAIELLDYLQKENYTMAVVTNKVKKSAEAALKHTGLHAYFDVVVSSEDVENPKPHKDHVLKALELLNIEVHNDIYMIGDAFPDISSAHNAGIHSVLVHTTDYAHFPHKPHSVVKDLQELLTFVKTENL